MDDAAVVRLDDHRVLVQTVDFFTPVVDDPYMFGQIAAANALSDVYAMGCEPFTAMNIIGFPSCLEFWVLEDILRGGLEKVKEAGALLVGGHSIETPEPLFGMAVTGIADPGMIIANSGAKSGDLLVLTKPLGTGIMATAIKGEIIQKEHMDRTAQWMAKLNKEAAVAMRKAGATGCTDITGFGFLGHALEMATASSVSMHIAAEAIPVIEGTREYAEMGLVPAGSYRNRKYTEGRIMKKTSVPEYLDDILYDPQTSGGLLISVNPKKLDILMDSFRAAGEELPPVVGEVGPADPGRIFIE